VNPRRRRASLEEAVERATTKNRRAIALYELGLFRDNNARERDAIPLYERAIKAGLDPALKAKALAWLASSLYKTGQLRRAMSRIQQSRQIARTIDDSDLQKFLDGLETRVRRLMAKPT
jgi:tetratricopeptide (TPR) repeat protein